MTQRFSWLKQASLYNFRFVIGYGAIVLIVLVTLLVDINSLPNGISQAEMQSAVQSTDISLKLPQYDWLINAPYHVLQKLSISALGLSRLSLVLPSIAIGVLTLLLFWLTIRHWFKKSTAVIATLVTASTIPFISMLRTGAPDIMLPFWTILFLFAGVRFLINREKGFRWKLLLVVATAGLLYTPFGIYSFLAFVVGGIFHPHVRSRLRHVKRVRLLLLTVIFIGLIAPLLVALAHMPTMFYTLTGLDHTTLSPQRIVENLLHAIYLYGNFSTSTLAGTYITPAFNVASVVLMLLGFMQLVRNHHTAQSYAILTWFGISVVVALLVSQSYAVVLMPVLMLLANGIRTLINEWYELFPRNPYARLAGLATLSVLFIGITTGNLSHYFHTLRYVDSPAYNASLSAVKRSIVIEGNRPMTLVTDVETADFYRILTRSYPNVSVTSTAPQTISQPTLVLPNVASAYDKAPSRIFVTFTKQNSVVLRVYRP